MARERPASRRSSGGGRFRRLVRSRRFTLQIYTLFRDVFRHFRAATVRILVSSAASLACQAFALLTLYVYLRALEHNELLLGFVPRESPQLFMLVALASLLLLGGYALLEYRTNIAILSLCRHYQSLGTAEALALSSKLAHWFSADDENHISVRHLRQMLSVDVHHRSRMARVLLLGIVPAARLILCMVALLYLNWQFSVLILFAVGIPVAGLYSVGKKVADTITIRETGAPAVFPVQRDLLDSSWEQNTPVVAGAIDWETTLGHADSRYRQYFRRLRAKAHGTFLINIANTVGIMVLVMALGFWVLDEQQGNWSLWLTYLVVLRYFLASLRSTAQSVVKSTRFLRQTQRFTAFLAAAGAAAVLSDPSSAPCPKTVAQAFQGTGNRVDLDDDDDDDD